MNIPGDLIIIGIILIGILLIFSIGISETMPVFARNEFDNICDNYLALLSTKGGLDSIDKTNLENELINIGYKNITITAPTNAEWGSEVTLKVEAYYDVDSINPDLSDDIKTKKSTYENSTRVFGLEN